MLTEVNGTRVWVEDSGGPGELLLLSHGLLWSARMFSAQIDHFRGRFRVIAWDHRGQGRSDAPDTRSVPIEQVYEDAVALMDKLGLDRVHFGGLSMGGFVGMRLAARRPERVRSLILMETTMEPEPAENVPKYRRLAWIARYVGVWPVATPVMRIMFSKTVLADPARAADVARWRAELLENRPTITKAVYGVIEREGIDVRGIRAPTTVIVGEDDVATVPAKAERIVAAIPGAVLRRIPAAGHSSSMEQPAAVIAAMEEHFARLS